MNINFLNTLLISITLTLGLGAEAGTLKKSEARLGVEAIALIDEMEDAKKQGPCVAAPYKKSLLELSTLLMRDVAELKAPLNQQVSASINHIHQLHDAIEKRNICSGPSTATPKQSKNQPSTRVQLGMDAGKSAKHSNDSLFLGTSAGHDALRSDHSLLAGDATGYTLINAPYSVLLGAASGQTLADASFAVALGSSAARLAKHAPYSLFIGSSAGYGAENVDFSILSGYAAGRWIKDNKYSIIAGYAAGEYASDSSYSIFGGTFAGYKAKKSPRAVILGSEAGMHADRSPYAVLIGDASGKMASNTENAVFIGSNAGETAANTRDVVLIGSSADAEPGIHNAVGIGAGANPAQSNTWHIPEELNMGLGIAKPTAQLHTTRNIRFEALPDGVLVTDNQGNVSASPLLKEALKEIALLKARLDVLESKKACPK